MRLRKSTDFGFLTCGIFVVFRQRRSYYCARRRVVTATLCCGVKIFTSRLTTHIGLLKGTTNALYRVWEPKEGGKISPKKLSWAETKFSENGIFYRLFCLKEQVFWCVAKAWLF